MKTKKFNHNDVEKCKLSKQDIYTEKDNYAIVLDCIGSSISSIGFYKAELLKDLIKGKGKKVAKTFMEQAKQMSQGIMKNIGIVMGVPKQEEVYEVEEAYT